MGSKDVMVDQLSNEGEWRPSGIDDLEPAAWEALRSSRNTSVIAGPGGGKTELLAQRACYLLQNGITKFPRRILAISFKRDAAKNLKDRVSQRCGPEDAARFDSFTFDAFAKSLLDRFRSGLLENWRPSADYEILFPNRNTFTNFLDGLSQTPSANNEWPGLRTIRRDMFERNAVLGLPLPEGGIVLVDASAWAASQWWEQSLHVGTRSSLTFPMIGRLAELLVRLNPLIHRALLATYSHVFLDEFQDTTHVQYDLVHSIFHGSESVLTAVGDNKQQIMRWAMALDDAFEKFEADFGAERVSLVRNYRSSPNLVNIQHSIAVGVDPNSVHAEPQIEGDFSQDACKIMEFATPEEEAKYLGDLISSDTSNGNLNPRDFVILVRQRPHDYLSDMDSIFQELDVKVRDEGDIQDVLADHLIIILISFLRLGSSQRSPKHWTECSEITARLWGLDPDDVSEGRRLSKALGTFHSTLRGLLGEMPASPDHIRSICKVVIEFLGEDNIKAAYSEYGQGTWYNQMLQKAVHYLHQSCENHESWNTALDDFEGVNSIPLMTIHKSKGLEYHTVIFLALDDRAWWSFRREPDEARSTFFVAFSRAKQRVIFTYCQRRGGRSDIASLYELLRDAGVPTYEYSAETGEQLL